MTKPRPFNGWGFFLASPASLGMVAVLLLTALVYLPGLKGPFLFDDPPNIVVPISAWLNGDTGWREIVFSNHSGPLGRPISMISFLANAWMSGLSVLPYKLTNLVIHLMCGWMIFALFCRLLPRDPQLNSISRWVAMTIAALWLLHPMQVSTVLYVVQRMAQLSMLFTLLALVAYVRGRSSLGSKSDTSARLWLFLGVPLATGTAMLCKENGALVPLLCAVIEIGYFRSLSGSRRPLSVKLFFAAFLVVPGLFAIALIALRPEKLLNAYAGRSFTLGERLLSEPRALFDYMGALLLPRGSALGIYTDDFIVSRGLFDPATTAASILGLFALLVAAYILRNRAVAVSTGILFFLAGHAMESTIFPLELYFEHRNYLPSAGLFLALVGLCGWKLADRVDGPALRSTHSLIRFAAIALCAVLAFSTFARASAWRHWPVLAEQGIHQHPQSLRAHLDYASMLMADGQLNQAEEVFEGLTASDSQLSRNVGYIDVLFVQCFRDHRATMEDVNRLDLIVGSKLQLGEALALEKIGTLLETNKCEGLDRYGLANTMQEIVDLAPQPETLLQKWRTRYVASRLYAKEGRYDQAIAQAGKAWMSGAADPAIGLFLANLYYVNNDPVSARTMIADIERTLKSWDTRNHELIARLQEEYEQGSSE